MEGRALLAPIRVGRSVKRWRIVRGPPRSEQFTDAALAIECPCVTRRFGVHHSVMGVSNTRRSNEVVIKGRKMWRTTVASPLADAAVERRAAAPQRAPRVQRERAKPTPPSSTFFDSLCDPYATEFGDTLNSELPQEFSRQRPEPG